MEKFPQIEGLGDHEDWGVAEVERYRDDLVRRGILDVVSEIDDNCPACGRFGWRKKVPPECDHCIFGLVAGHEESTTEIRMRAFLHRVLMFEPKRRDPFSLNARHAAATDQRLEAIPTIGLLYKDSRRLLSELGVRENIQASHMLCVALGTIAMHNLGVDDSEWLIDEVALRLGDEDFAKFVKQAEVRSGLRSVYRDVWNYAEAGDLGKAYQVCQYAFIRHFADYAEASKHQEKIVKCVADMVAHATVVSNLKATMSHGAAPPTGQGKQSGCIVLALCGIVASGAVKALIETI